MTDAAPHNQALEDGTSELADLDRLLSEGRRRLSEAMSKPPCQFTFNWRGIGFTAVVESAGGGYRLQVSGDLGGLPHSAEDPLARARLCSLVGWSDPDAPCRFVIGPRSRISCVGTIELAAPPSGIAIMSELTRYLLLAKPHLTLAIEQRGQHINGDVVRAAQ